MAELDPRLETFFTIQNLSFGRGEETPQFEGILMIKGREAAIVKNSGRGGCNTYFWKDPFSRRWADSKLFPLASKIAAAKDPEFKTLYESSGSTAFDSLVFDYVEKERVAQRSSAPRRETRVEIPAGIQVNAKVRFGRENGEETLGMVVKVNAKSVKVKTLEVRGKHPVGTIFRVGPSFLTPA